MIERLYSAVNRRLLGRAMTSESGTGGWGPGATVPAALAQRGSREYSRLKGRKLEEIDPVKPLALHRCRKQSKSTSVVARQRYGT